MLGNKPNCNRSYLCKFAIESCEKSLLVSPWPMNRLEWVILCNIVTELGIAMKEIRIINSLKSKRRLLYLKTQFVPRSKHFSSRL
jgi:hypothetical protein